MRHADRARDLVGVSDLVSDLDHYLVSARALVSSLDSCFGSPRDDLARNLAHDLDRVSARTRVVIVFFSGPSVARDLALARDLASDLARDFELASALDRASALVSALDRARRAAASGASAVVTGGARPMPGRVPRRLVALAVWWLPVAQRPRYREEFGAELVELPHRARWGYALRLVASTWKLRTALVKAVHPSGGEQARRAER